MSLGGGPPAGAGHHELGEYPAGASSASQGLWIPGPHIVLSSLKMDCLALGLHPPEEPRAIILDLGTQGTRCPPHVMASPTSFIHILPINSIKFCLLVGTRASVS